MKRRHLLLAMVDGGGNVPAENVVTPRLCSPRTRRWRRPGLLALKPLQVTSGPDQWHRYLLAS